MIRTDRIRISTVALVVLIAIGAGVGGVVVADLGGDAPSAVAEDDDMDDGMDDGMSDDDMDDGMDDDMDDGMDDDMSDDDMDDGMDDDMSDDDMDDDSMDDDDDGFPVNAQFLGLGLVLVGAAVVVGYYVVSP